MTRTARGTNMVDYVLNSRFGHDCTRHDGHNQPFRVRLTGYVFTVRCVGYKKTILNCRHCRHSWHQQKRFCYWRAGEDEEGNVHLLRKLRQIPVRKDDLRKNISIQHHQWRGWVFWYPWQLITMAASNINYKTKKKSLLFNEFPFLAKKSETRWVPKIKFLHMIYAFCRHRAAAPIAPTPSYTRVHNVPTGLAKSKM